MSDGSEPIDDDELIYRRVPASTGWYTDDGILLIDAFRPSKSDHSGLSVSRAKYKTVEEAARGQPGKSYFVAILRARDLRDKGLAVTPMPLLEDPGHAELPDLNSANRKDTVTIDRQGLLVQLTIRVEGPFLATESPPEQPPA